MLEPPSTDSRTDARAASGPTPIIALDFATADAAMAMVDRLPGADFFKVGSELFTSAGPDIVHALRDRGSRIFLDLKFHDIPNTVAGAVASAARLGVDLLTIHASGGPGMIAAAVRAAAEAPMPPAIFAVTVLTSLDGGALGNAWGRRDVEPAAEVARLARLASDAGADGVVASALDVDSIRQACPASLRILTPGIRFADGDAGDQARVASPALAARLGIDFVVVGRPITRAPDPAAAFSRLLGELGSAAE